MNKGILKVGDKVYDSLPNRTIKEMYVVAVGRKYIKVAHTPTGRTDNYIYDEKADVLREETNYGCPNILYLTKERIERNYEYSDLQKYIANVNMNKLSLEQLKEIKKIIEGKE